MTKNIKYKKPALVNLTPSDLINVKRLYVLPIFIKSGKHTMMIKHKDVPLNTYDWYFERDIVDFR